MSYTCRLYLNSGFNTVNIPDSPSLLNSLNYVDCQPLQILQNRDLQYVDIHVISYDSVKDADYCKVGDWFYFVAAIQMLNANTARISLVTDYLTSAGGPSALHVLDGITTRVHTSTDTFGEWTEDDPYMAPASPLKIETERLTTSSQTVTVIKSTLDLEAMGTATSNPATYYEDAVTGEGVAVPRTQMNTSETEYELHMDSPAANLSIDGEGYSKLFNANGTYYPAIKEGLQVVNDLQINGSVTAQVVIPLSFVTPEYNGNPNGVISKMVGQNALENTNLLYEYANVRNKKINYSNYTPYGIVTASGAKCEYKPYQIYEQGRTSPRIRVIGDPRTDGKPYFRYAVLDGDNTLPGFFNSAVEGMPWKQVPLVYEGATGQAIAQLEHNQKLKQLAFDTDVATADIVFDKERTIWGNAGQAIGNVIGSGIEGLLGGGAGAASSIASSIMNPISFVASSKNISDAYDRKYDIALAKYELDRKNEMQTYKIASKVYSPTVQFPFSADLYRDLLNNGCVAYRYKYSNFDIARIDKILTMYGYRVTKNVEASDFNNRTKFNYIEAGITVGKLPRWWADGINAQISSGVRIWHVLPDNSHYTDNPIAS